MEEDIYSPSVEEFRLAFVAFMLAVSSVAYHRGRKFGPKRMAYVARSLAKEFSEKFTARDAELLMADSAEGSRGPLGTLFEEFIYIACRYSKSMKDAGMNVDIPGNTGNFEGEIGNPFSDEALDDIETVKGSIAKLLEKLPKWAQRIIEALMEALKLTRGG